MSDAPIRLRLARCDLRSCEAVCCYDGVYLLEGEESMLREVVAARPGVFDLPAEYIVDGVWRGEAGGQKTAVRPHRYRPDSLPIHFEQTRCVFTLSDGKCSLQVQATAEGIHPWAWKPRACWMHPLREGRDDIVPPPVDQADDPDRIDNSYLGYTTFTPCGRHAPEGEPWESVLHEELEYRFAARTRLPIGSTTLVSVARSGAYD